MELEDLIQTIENQHQIISVVGAGGKSTLIRTLAERLSRRGRRVLVTTTTHIWKPEDGTYAEGEAEAERLWKQGRYAVVGVPASLWGNESAQQKNAGNQGLKSKLTSLPEKELHQYMKAAEIVLIEADGAKCNPCKIPAAHEPVILEESTLIIGVMGMDCLNRPVSEVCFRWQEGEGWLWLAGKNEMAGQANLWPEQKESEKQQSVCKTCMTTALAAQILSSERGTRKNCGSREYAVVLNKCDTDAILRQAEEIEHRLNECGIREVFKLSLEPPEGTDKVPGNFAGERNKDT